jgi:hypothetical protein
VDDDQSQGGATPDSGLQISDYEAGPDHVIVVYAPPDTGGEIDANVVFAAVAADASARAATGLRMLSMTSMDLRHSGVAFGAQGSGYATKVAVAVVYERWPGVPG